LQNTSQQFILLQKLIEIKKKKLKSINGLSYSRCTTKIDYRHRHQFFELLQQC